ncbi:hypothetical protein KG826_005087, partial [Escherichia coli]|nr:hypothetical protein [Escherichia coli]
HGLAVCCGSTVSRDTAIGGCNICICQVKTRVTIVRRGRQVDVVGGRQRGIGDITARCRGIQREVARGDIRTVCYIYTIASDANISRVTCIGGIQGGVCKADGTPIRTAPGKSNVTGRQRAPL